MRRLIACVASSLLRDDVSPLKVTDTNAESWNICFTNQYETASSAERSITRRYQHYSYHRRQMSSTVKCTHHLGLDWSVWPVTGQENGIYQSLSQIRNYSTNVQTVFPGAPITHSNMLYYIYEMMLICTPHILKSYFSHHCTFRWSGHHLLTNLWFPFDEKAKKFFVYSITIHRRLKSAAG